MSLFASEVMSRLRGVVPRFFLRHFGANGRRPERFVLLLAAMASATVYAVAWVAAIVLLLPLDELLGTPAALLFPPILWGSATLWYHVAYLSQCRRDPREAVRQERQDTGEPTLRVEVHYYSSYDYLILLIRIIVELIVLMLKYIAGPFVPLLAVLEFVTLVPEVGVC